MRLFRDLPTVYLHRDVVDFRKSIDGLAAIVEQQMDLDPFADALYVFCNRHRDRLKVLYWDQTGFCLWYKRLEKAKFQWPRKHHDGVIRWDEREFNWLLEGFDVMRMQGHAELHFSATNAVADGDSCY